MVLVKFFASSADIVGQRQMQLELTEEETVSSFLDRLCEAHPRLAGLRPAMRVAVNHEYVDVSFGIRDGDEVALIPPVSGGLR